MAKSPYDILGVPKTAAEDEIKAAYRKLAKEHHPDLNPDDEAALQKFKDVNAAYDFLKDKEKKAAFDRGEIDMNGQPRWAGAGAGAGAGGGGRYRYDFSGSPGGAGFSRAAGGMGAEDLGDIFSSIFGGGGRKAGGGAFSDMFRSQPRAEDLDAQYRLDVGFMEAVKGAKKRITLPDGKTLDVKIPAGVKDGQRLRLKGKGKKGAGERVGDAYVAVHVKPHKLYSRKGNDIYADLPVGIHEAVLGKQVPVETIHGTVKMKLPKGTDSGTRLRLKGKGISAGKGKEGDHYAQVKIVMPDKIDPDLEDAMTQWAKTHEYDPRKKG